MLKQISAPRFKPLLTFCAVFWLGLMMYASPRVLAQGTESGNPERQRALRLFDESKFADAQPILEKLAASNPSDAVVLERLGFSIYANSTVMKDPQARKQARERARAILLRAQSLGDNSQLLRVALEALSSADAADVPFSRSKEADAAMREGEEAYTHGELDKALAAYERAYQLDSKLYEAALFAGDMYFKKGFNATDRRSKQEQVDKAGEWFARAIAINEDRETAHRYWGDALMSVGKMDEARAKLIEAIIAEPYNQRSYNGLTQWADRNRVSLAHPQIKPPNSTRTEGDKTTISIDPKTLQSADGASNWMLYDITRAAWADGRFTKEFPGEKVYRHSLREEAEALRLVAEAAAKDLKTGKAKSLEPSLATLVKLNDAGLLEAYILFARVDRGIAHDYAAYR